MDSMAMIIMAVFIIGTGIMGAIPGMKNKLSAESWAVGDRSFGRWLNWFIMAGEVYTAFAFLGASGWAYAKGGPTFYILGYSALGYIVGYHILPKFCEAGHKFDLMTQGDLMERVYNSRPLGIILSCIGVAFLLPYLQLQLTALGLIVEVCSLGAIGKVTAMLIAFVLVALFVFVSGIKGVASTSIVKDVMMMGSMAFFGLYMPIHYFGSPGNMFETLNQIRPDYLIFPGATGNLDVVWGMSTFIVMALGFYMWPQLTSNAFSAKNADVMRHNAVWLPLCQVFLIFPMLIGFTAVMVYADNPLKTPDMAFMYMVKDTFPTWVLGIIGGAGALACMIPAANLLLSTSLLISRNIYVKGFRNNEEVSNEHMKNVARYMVLLLTAVALYLSIFHSNMLVNLLLTGYSGVTQFFPALVLGLFWKKATKAGAYAGILVGEILVFYLMLNKMDPFPFMGEHLNAGFVAFVCNLAVFAIVSLMTYKEEA